MRPLTLTPIAEAEPIGLMTAVLPWLGPGPGNVGKKHSPLFSSRNKANYIFSNFQL